MTGALHDVFPWVLGLVGLWFGEKIVGDSWVLILYSAPLIALGYLILRA